MKEQKCKKCRGKGRHRDGSRCKWCHGTGVYVLLPEGTGK